jgi:hypothetical protein
MWDNGQESGVECSSDALGRCRRPAFGIRARSRTMARPSPETPAEVTLTAPSFEARLRALVANFAGQNDNPGSLACERCERATSSTFCMDCRDIRRCHYCKACKDCTECSHCVKTTGCLSCSHCVDCEKCVSSAYLIRSVGCTGSSYLFGCVGLHHKDFHILNEPYDRQTYFAVVARLSRELRL